MPHMCLRTVLTQHFLTKPLTPPCANQGFAYAKCSYDKALIKTIQNGFWGRSYDKPTNKTKGHVLSLNPVLLSGFGCLDRTHHSGALPRRSSALRSRGWKKHPGDPHAHWENHRKTHRKMVTLTIVYLSNQKKHYLTLVHWSWSNPILST